LDNEEPIVWHESILDEYWDRIKMYWMKRLGIVTHLQFVNVEAKKERLAALDAIFRDKSTTTSIVNFNFANANLCQEGIVYLSKMVYVSSKLQFFSLKRNRLDDIDSASCLSRALKSRTSMSRLNVSHCDLGSSPEILLVLLQSDVHRICLDYNNIDSLGAVKIAEYLEDDPPICCIDLDHNRLNDDDAVLISQALKRNTNLETLFIQSNNFTSIGVKALLTCVFDGSSLNAISESNHTLAGMELFDEESNKNSRLVQGCIDRLLDLDRINKIMLALQDKDSLLQYLANVPVELIPEVLTFPCGRIVDEFKQKHLNIVYSTMRWWNMPMLYSYHHCVKSDTKRKREMTVYD
jgi:hypothetical protein